MRLVVSCPEEASHLGGDGDGASGVVYGGVGEVRAEGDCAALGAGADIGEDGASQLSCIDEEVPAWAYGAGGVAWPWAVEECLALEVEVELGGDGYGYVAEDVVVHGRWGMDGSGKGEAAG